MGREDGGRKPEEEEFTATAVARMRGYGGQEDATSYAAYFAEATKARKATAVRKGAKEDVIEGRLDIGD